MKYIIIVYTILSIYFFTRLLKRTSESDDESSVEFAARVQHLIANDLGIVSTSYTSADKSELVKRVIRNQVQSGGDMVTSQLDEMTIMARQVQTVLPHVPLQNIKDDLGGYINTQTDSHAHTHIYIYIGIFCFTIINCYIQTLK